MHSGPALLGSPTCRVLGGCMSCMRRDSCWRLCGASAHAYYHLGSQAGAHQGHTPVLRCPDTLHVPCCRPFCAACAHKPAAHAYRHLGGHAGVNDGCALVCCKDAQGVVPEVCHADKAAAAEASQTLQSQLPGVPQVQIIPAGFSECVQASAGV
jgi:hypothetical protein